MKFKSTLLPLALCVGLAACGGKTYEEHLSSANQYIENEDPSSALIELKNAIQLSPEQADARFLLGKLYFDDGQMLFAEKELQRTYELDAENAENIQYLVRAAFLNGSYPVILSLAESNPSDLLLLYSAIVDLQEGRIEQAEGLFNSLSEKSSDAKVKSLAKAYVHISKDELDAAVVIVDQILVQNPHQLEALQLKGQLGMMPGRYENSIAAYNTLLELMPQHLVFKLYLASALVNSQKFEDAEPHVDEILKINPDAGYPNQLKGQILFSYKNFDQAKEYAEKAIQARVDLATNRLIAGYSHYKLEKFEQAYAHLSALKDRLPPEHLARKIIIDLQLKLGYQDQAFDEINDLGAMTEADAALLTGASDYFLKSGRTEEAKELLAASVDLNSTDATEITKQGLMQLKLMDGEAGIASFERALELDPNLQAAEQGLAVGYLANGQTKEAIVLAKKWQASADKVQKAQGLILESSVLHEQEKFPEAKALLLEVLELDKNNVAALFKLGVYAHQDKQFDQAYDYYTRVLDNQISHIGALKNAVSLTIGTAETPVSPERYTSLENFFLEKEKMSKAEKYKPKQALALLYSAHEKYDESLAQLKEIKGGLNAPDDTDVAIADIYLKQRNWNKAIDNYKPFMQKHPENIQVAQRLFTAYEMAGKVDKAHTQVKNSLKYQPENTGLRLLKIYYESMLDIFIDRKELSFLGENEATKDHWLYHRTLANEAYNKGDTKTANGFYKKAYETFPNVVNVVSWAKTEEVLVSTEAAIKILEKHLETDDASAVKIMIADAHLRNKANDKAAALYEEIIQEQPDNIVVLNNLGYLHVLSGNNESALKFSKKAASLAANNPAVLDTYAQALSANKQHDEAIEVFNKALATVPGNVEISINKIKALIAAGQKDQAQTVIQRLDELTADERRQINELKAQL